MEPIKTIEWIADQPKRFVPGMIRLVDQTRLPGELILMETRDLRQVWTAIKTLQVRGAPAIGIAAALGVVVAVQDSRAATGAALAAEVDQAADYLATSRPTAVNLFWAIDRMKRCFGAAVQSGASVDEIKLRLEAEARAIDAEDVASCRAIGRFGGELVPDRARILTHCNAGALATAGYGTALGVVRGAIELGKQVSVYADETRPFLQGARLTAWELIHDGIDTTVITDNMAATFMRQGLIDLIVVGADRIAANGDVANKVGTYGLAVLAKEHGLPFYVAAPSSTLDLATPSGAEIPIEERPDREVTHIGTTRLTPVQAKIRNPAFDITPARYVTAIVTERGVWRAPYGESLRQATA